MDEFGLYYSTYNEEKLKPSIRTIRKGGYAHFGDSHTLIEVIKYIKRDSISWTFMPSVERHFIMPKDLIEWKDQ